MHKSNQITTEQIHMLVFGESGKPENPGKNLSRPSREPINSTHMWQRVREIEPGTYWWKASALNTTRTLRPHHPKRQRKWRLEIGPSSERRNNTRDISFATFLLWRWKFDLYQLVLGCQTSSLTQSHRFLRNKPSHLLEWHCLSHSPMTLHKM